jgi:hypothetical protein
MAGGAVAARSRRLEDLDGGLEVPDGLPVVAHSPVGVAQRTAGNALGEAVVQAPCGLEGELVRIGHGLPARALVEQRL